MTLFDLRSAAGWTQTELAERIGVSRQSIVWWETGRAIPFGKNLIKLARVFGVDPGQIEWRNKDDIV